MAPPFYVLLSHSPISTSNPGALSNTLAHPTIQYHYADDSPLALWPQHPDKHVLVMDYDPRATKPPIVQSLSRDVAVAHLKVEEAPGAAVASENEPKNDKMYIIETIASDSVVDVPYGDHQSAFTALEQFKRRNAILRRVLLYPEASGHNGSSQSISLPFSPLRSDS